MGDSMTALSVFRLALATSMALGPAIAQEASLRTVPPRTTGMGEVALGGDLPADLTRPEGRTRWDLGGLKTRATWVRRLEDEAGSGAVVEHLESQGAEG